MKDRDPRFSHRSVLKYRGGRFRETETPVIDEVPVTVTLNGREIITFLASDDALDYLAVGFLKSEGLIEEKEDHEKMPVRKFFNNTFGTLLNDAIFALMKK